VRELIERALMLDRRVIWIGGPRSWHPRWGRALLAAEGRSNLVVLELTSAYDSINTMLDALRDSEPRCCDLVLIDPRTAAAYGTAAASSVPAPSLDVMGGIGRVIEARFHCEVQVFGPRLHPAGTAAASTIEPAASAASVHERIHRFLPHSQFVDAVRSRLGTASSAPIRGRLVWLPRIRQRSLRQIYEQAPLCRPEDFFTVHPDAYVLYLADCGDNALRCCECEGVYAPLPAGSRSLDLRSEVDQLLTTLEQLEEEVPPALSVHSFQ
jgi:hypothetical protein